MAAGLGARRHTRRASSWVQFVRPNAEGREAGACRLTRVPMSPRHGAFGVWVAIHVGEPVLVPREGHQGAPASKLCHHPARGAEQIRATASLNRPPVLALKRVPRGSDHTAQALTFFFGAGRAMMHLEQSRPTTFGCILLTRVSRSDRASFTEPSKLGKPER